MVSWTDIGGINDTLTMLNQAYRLLAVVFHSGPNPMSGHYIASAKHDFVSGGGFFLYDDLKVRRSVEFPGKVCDACYGSATLLLYEKVSVLETEAGMSAEEVEQLQIASDQMGSSSSGLAARYSSKLDISTQ